MSTYFRTSRLVKAAVVVLSASGSAFVIKHLLDERSASSKVEKPNGGVKFVPEIKASWTTNHKPSVSWDHNWDKREPSSLVKPKKGGKKKRATTETDKGDGKDVDKNNNIIVIGGEEEKPKVPSATRHLILIRHGQYHDNATSDHEQTLTELGREQADLTGARLKELSYPYSLMVNSTMPRAVETAGIISKHLPDVRTSRTDLLREGAPIPPEPPVGHWRPEVHQFFRDGSRIEAAFRQYFHRADLKQKEDSYEILVCHANVIRYFVCRALQFPPEAWLRISLHHGSITWMTIRPNGRVSILTMGDCGHMPLNKLSYR